MHMVNITAPSSYSTALKILLPLGEYFQAQDDYLDCYGNPETIGKIGTDILDNKCSWNINVALGKATVAQRAVLDVSSLLIPSRPSQETVLSVVPQANYGQRNSESENLVKQVYKEIGIAGLFEEYEAKSYKEINALIETIPEAGGDGLKREVFESFLAKVYKRTK